MAVVEQSLQVLQAALPQLTVLLVAWAARELYRTNNQIQQNTEQINENAAQLSGLAEIVQDYHDVRVVDSNEQ